VRVVPNGRDPRLYSPAEAVPGAAARLVWIGQLDVTKRPERFLALVGELRAQGYELEARVAGSGPRLEELREPARAAGVELLGSVADVPALLAASDLLVFTGRPPEGLPGVLIEAGMAALPVVTTDVPGARDVVVDGVTGRVVPVDDPGALAGATGELLDDADARVRLGRAARARCERELGLDASLGKWRALLDELLQEACTSST
jgi:glycosyltransferase involved in cell wall biosynthesis